MNHPKKQPQNPQEEFPGYPHYPSREDISRHSQEVSLGNLKRPEEEASNATTEAEAAAPPPEERSFDADISPEEQAFLDASFQHRNMARPDLEEPLLDTQDSWGDALNERHQAYHLEGADLDVPGAEADDADEAIGEEDEENNYYSLGQDSLPEHTADEDL